MRKMYFVCGLLLASGGTYFAVSRFADSNQFKFELPELRQIAAGETVEYIIAAKNFGSRDIRVVGLTWC